MLKLWWQLIRLVAILGVMLWFLAVPLMPVYGLLRPWPQAREKLREEGITGLPLMIGGGGQSEQRIDSAGRFWRKERQRSYVVLPDSFRRLEIIIYSETEGSGIRGVQQAVSRDQWLVPLFVVWILAGMFTVRMTSDTRSKWRRTSRPGPLGASAPRG